MTQSAPQTQLFAGLDDADKAAVAEALQTQGIGPTIDPVTGALTADADKRYQARIALAGQGLPRAQPTGDRPNTTPPIGTSRPTEGAQPRAGTQAGPTPTNRAGKR